MKESSIYLEEKKKFIEELRRLEEVQNLEKMKKVNILIYILLIVVTPIIVILGFYFKIIPLYIIAGIALIIGLIYTFINENKCKKIVGKLAIKQVVKFFNSNYGIRTISKKMKEQICEKNNKIFVRNYAIEEQNRFCLDAYIESKHLTRIVKDGKDIDLFLYSEQGYDATSKTTMDFCNFILVGKFIKDGVFYLSSKDNEFLSKDNRLNYDKIFLNYEKDVIKILKKIEKEPKEEKYIELTEEQKKRLVEIYNRYPNHFKILIKDGYVYIKMRKYIYTSVKCLEEVFDFENCLNELLLNFV